MAHRIDLQIGTIPPFHALRLLPVAASQMPEASGGHWRDQWKVSSALCADWCLPPVLEDSFQNVPLEDSFQNVPLEDSFQNVPLEDSFQNVPLEDSFQNVPLEDSFQNVPLEDSFQNEDSPVPLEDSFQNVPERRVSCSMVWVLPLSA